MPGIWRPPSAPSTTSGDLRSVAWILCALASACGGEPLHPPTPAPVTSAGVAPDASEVARAGPWDRAGEGDDLAIRRLAEMHPAPALYQVVRGDAARAEVALRALAHADDAELALGDVAEMALRGERRHAALEVVLRVVSRRPSGSERLDPPSLERCIVALAALSRDEGVAQAERAIAVSALRALARAGLVDEDSITTALDPP